MTRIWILTLLLGNVLYSQTKYNPWTGQLDYVGTGGGGSSVWGAITGTLSDQTDLNTALNAKLPAQCTVTAAASTATIHTPCSINVGGVWHNLSSNATAILSGTSGTGTVYFYWSADGTLTADQSTAAALTCSGCTAASTGGVPVGAFPLATAAFTANVFSGTIADQRSYMSMKTIYCGLGLTCTVNGTTGELTVTPDTTNTLLSIANYQSSAPSVCASATASMVYACSLTPAITGYTTGMVVQFKPTVTAMTGAASVNINGLGAKNIKQADGTSNPSATAMTVGQQFPLWYDGTVFRLPAAGGGTNYFTQPAAYEVQYEYDVAYSGGAYMTVRNAGGGLSVFRLCGAGATCFFQYYNPNSGVYSFNDQFYFSSGKMGIGAAPTTNALEVTGAISATTNIVATGIVSGTAPVSVTTACTTGAHCSLGATYKSGYTFNQHATAATAVFYDLPATAVGMQYCVKNSYNGSAANTGIITIKAPASSYLINAGAIGSSGGTIASTAVAGAAACFVAIDATHWEVYPSLGTWAP